MTTNDSRIYSVLILDDEALARTLLQEYLAKMPQFRLAASCCHVHDALTYLQQHPVDILLTDIQMPDISGIEFVRGMLRRPAVIFTTAYSEYAVEGFDLCVVDYLLKPVGFPRFMQAMQKAEKYVQMVQMEELPADNGREKTGENGRGTADFITVKADRKLHKINFNDLIYVEGKHEYVTFHTLQRNITALGPLKQLENQLPAGQFIRIHKSFIVAVRYIETLTPRSLSVQGTELPVGSSYRDQLLERLNMQAV